MAKWYKTKRGFLIAGTLLALAGGAYQMSQRGDANKELTHGKDTMMTMAAADRVERAYMLVDEVEGEVIAQAVPSFLERVLHGKGDVYNKDLLEQPQIARKLTDAESHLRLAETKYKPHHAHHRAQLGSLADEVAELSDADNYHDFNFDAFGVKYRGALLQADMERHGSPKIEELQEERSDLGWGLFDWHENQGNHPWIPDMPGYIPLAGLGLLAWMGSVQYKSIERNRQNSWSERRRRRLQLEAFAEEAEEAAEEPAPETGYRPVRPEGWVAPALV